MQLKRLLTFFTLFSVLIVGAQNTGILKGTIKTDQGEPVMGASILIKSLSIGTTSNESGEYLIKGISNNSYIVEVSYLGYNTISKKVKITDFESTQNFTLTESSFLLEGIIVTSQKREQKNKDVPIAITSYGTDFIENTGTYEYDALSDYVPGLQVQIQSVNNPGVVIRGITSDSGDSRAEPRVSIFQDGVSISKSRGSVVELFDIERVEVLKGPQGTLFGRGAQIGAMHIIQNKAKNETSGSLKLGYGNYNQFLISGHMNLPIVTDKLFFRTAAIYNARDGYIENLSGGDLNGKETTAFRTSLKYLISNNTSVDIIANWQKDTPPGTAFKSGVFAPTGGDTSPFTFANLERGEELGVNRTVWGATGILKTTLSDTWNLTATSAYRTFDSDESFDADGTASEIMFFREISKGKQFSQEFRFNFDNDDKFRGFLGVNYFWEDGSQAVPIYTNEQQLMGFWMYSLTGVSSFFMNDGIPVSYTSFPDLTGIYDPLAPLAGAPLRDSNTEQYTNYGTTNAFDVFADASLDLTNKLTATLGLRLTYEDVSAGYKVDDAETYSYLNNIFPADGSGNNVYTSTGGEKITASDNFLSVVGRLAINYEINQNITVFGNIARGRRPNVINIDAEKTEVLNDEIVWSYEIGAKSLFLNNKLQLDANAFIYDYSHFQTDVQELEGTTFVSETRDSGNASAAGFEIGTQFAFAKNSSLFANYAYIDASFDNEDSDGNEQELAGNTFRLTPKHSISAGINYNPTVNKHLDLFFRPTFTYKSKVYFEEDNDEAISQAGYGIMNFKIGLELNKKYELTFFMNNAFNKQYIIDAGNTGGAFGIPTYIAGAPRFFGAQIKAQF